ncbi:MAG: hypothetical protein R3C53_21625 [Pirellulaceae bacterium]
MRMLGGRMHWLTVGLALLVGAQGWTIRTAHGQAPSKPAGEAAKRQAILASYTPDPYASYPTPAGGMMGGMPGGMPGGMIAPDGPTSMVFEGPPPMDAEMMYGDGGCDSMGGCSTCDGGLCGGRGCGLLQGRGLRGRRGCACGGVGCLACGRGGCLFGGRILGLLGPLAPYSEGGSGTQRWFDLYAGTIGLKRTSNFGGFATGVQDPQTGVFETSNIISTEGISGTPRLQSNDLSLDKMRYGLELIANLQVGAGSNLEARYFGLNNWDTSRSFRLNTPDLYSVFSQFGVSPPGGFDDTDRSFIHTISYNSELHNGEVNYRRRWVSPMSAIQGSWLAGVRYFDLDERFGFAAVGSTNNTFTFNTLRFANYDTITRNQLTGFQLGGDLWVGLMPGIQVGVEGKAGIFGNHAEVESQIVSNSIPGAREFLQDGKTAYVSELTASAVYRLTHSWSVRTSYNLLYVDNVALAAENVNARDFGNALGNGQFGPARFPFLNVDGEALYQGWSIGGEFLY